MLCSVKQNIGPKEILIKWVKVIKELLSMNNFHTSMAIISGLNNGAVQRLKEVWESLPKKYFEAFQTFENIFHPSQGYKNYKLVIAKREPPILPYMG